MNNRDYRKFGSNSFHHIYNRGNNKMNLFLDESDYYSFLGLLEENILGKKEYFCSKVFDPPPKSSHFAGKKYIRKLLPIGSFEIICFCLMPNHFHLLVKQKGELKVSKLLSKICTSYSKRFNKKYSHIGHVFQDQFKSVLVEDNNQLLHLSAYIHSNPKVGGLVKNIENWKFSSYSNFLNINKYRLCNKSIIVDQFRNIRSYKNFVEESVDKIKSIKNLNYALLDMES